jgi:23S rRNA (uracil1939-C5)-methyltransferase
MTSAPIYTLKVTQYAYGGEGIGRLPDGRAVFVPFTLAGEEVRLRLVEQKRGYARGELLEVLAPSPERIPPRCVHFGVCGGCHYQHLPYESQLAVKAGILRDQLERIGKLTDPPMHLVVPSPEAFNYRNHVQFDLTPEGRLGYHQERSQKVLAIQECHLPEPVLNQIWPQLDFEAEPGFQRVGMRLGADGDVLLVLESEDISPPALTVEDMPVSVVHLSPAGSLVLAGSEAVIVEVLGRAFQVSAGSFFQVNTRQAEQLVEHVLENIPAYQILDSSTTLVDAYCGVGLFSAFLASRVGRLIGVESNSNACEDFVVNLDEFDNVELYEAPLETVLPAMDIRPQVVLVDPPRAGIDRDALDGLLALNANLLVYVSCDPATLGRDARRLVVGGYELAQVTPFDMFPQTYHIESVSFWTKNN